MPSPLATHRLSHHWNSGRSFAFPPGSQLVGKIDVGKHISLAKGNNSLLFTERFKEFQRCCSYTIGKYSWEGKNAAR